MGRIGDMAVLFLLMFRFVRLLFSGHQAVAIENAALRMQIAAFQRERKRPLLTTLDRMFWITLRSLWGDWRKPLLYVQPDTVVRWQREAARAVPEILGSAFQAAASSSRPPSHRCRTPPIDRTNGRCQSAVARTQNSWRTQDARYRHFRAHCLAPPAHAPPAAEPDLEDLPAQPYRPNGIHRFLHRADHHDEGIVRISRPGTQSSQGAAFPCDRASDRGL